MVSNIGTELAVEGVLKSDGDIEVEGEVQGRIDAKQVTVLEGGRVKGEILADRVHIQGTVEGEIGAISVVLGQNAVVSAQITYQEIEVARGAFLVGALHGTDGLSG